MGMYHTSFGAVEWMLKRIHKIMEKKKEKPTNPSHECMCLCGPCTSVWQCHLSEPFGTHHHLRWRADNKIEIMKWTEHSNREWVEKFGALNSPWKQASRRNNNSWESERDMGIRRAKETKTKIARHASLRFNPKKAFLMLLNGFCVVHI